MPGRFAVWTKTKHPGDQAEDSSVPPAMNSDTVPQEDETTPTSKHEPPNGNEEAAPKGSCAKSVDEMLTPPPMRRDEHSALAAKGQSAAWPVTSLLSSPGFRKDEEDMISAKLAMRWDTPTQGAKSFSPLGNQFDLEMNSGRSWSAALLEPLPMELGPPMPQLPSLTESVASMPSPLLKSRSRDNIWKMYCSNVFKNSGQELVRRCLSPTRGARELGRQVRDNSPVPGDEGAQQETTLALSNVPSTPAAPPEQLEQEPAPDSAEVPPEVARARARIERGRLNKEQVLKEAKERQEAELAKQRAREAAQQAREAELGTVRRRCNSKRTPPPAFEEKEAEEVIEDQVATPCKEFVKEQGSECKSQNPEASEIFEKPTPCRRVAVRMKRKAPEVNEKATPSVNQLSSDEIGAEAGNANYTPAKKRGRPRRMSI